MMRECDICGHKFKVTESSDRLCELCLICESTRIQMGGPATPRYHRDEKAKLSV
jgi:hypothetical protein